MDCLGRIPFASFIATIICCAGVVVFCVTLYLGTTVLTRDIIDSLFHLGRFTGWISVVEIVFIVAGAAMGVFAIVLLVFGFLATGATRQDVYAGTRCIMGGRVTAAFLMFLSYVLNFIWLVVMVLMGGACFAMILVRSWCRPETERIDFNVEKAFDPDCFRLRNYGIHLNATQLQLDYTNKDIRTELCDRNDINNFCKFIDEASIYYFLALCGSVLVVIGLVHFMITLAANHTRIRNLKEQMEYRQIQFLICLSSNYHHIQKTRQLSEYRTALDYQASNAAMALTPLPPDEGRIVYAGSGDSIGDSVDINVKS